MIMRSTNLEDFVSWNIFEFEFATPTSQYWLVERFNFQASEVKLGRPRHGEIVSRQGLVSTQRLICQRIIHLSLRFSGTSGKILYID